MNEQLKNQFPEWINKVNQHNKLILTNDLDSLFTVALLRKLFGCEVGMFYDFKSLYSTQKKFDKKDIIGCDLAIEDNEIKTFCNHVTKMWKNDKVNPLSANLNNIAGIHGGKYDTNYFRKYNGSTVLTILSLYDAFDMFLHEGHTELTETQKMILVSIDSYFFGAYHPSHYEAHGYFYRWQQALGLEMFNDVFEKYTFQELIEFQEENNLKSEIFMTDQGLDTTLYISFLQEHFPMLDFNVDVEFITEHEFKNTVKQHYYTGESKHDLQGDVFSLSVINRDTVRYTLT